MRGTVPAGVVVPLHSHAERETFYVLEEEVQGLGITGSRSVLVTYSMCLAVSGTGWRNVSGASVSLLFVVPMRLGRFFRDIGRPVTMANQSAPGLADFQRLLEIAHAYGYWLGSPADNAAAGLSFG